MRRRSLAVLTGLVLALAGPVSADGRRACPGLPIIERGTAEPDADSLPQTSFELLPPVAPPANYRGLREAEVQCLAAKAAATANLLDREREQLAAAHPSQKKGWQLRQTILYYAALEDRNRAAGQALPLYFKAAELEAQIELLQLTRGDLAGAITKFDELARKGFHVPGDPGAVRRQLLDTEADRTRAEAGLVEVNSRLRESIGLCSDDWLWPLIEVPVTFEGVNPDAAVAVALAKRPQLLLLRELNSRLNKQSLPVVRDYLHGISGLLAASGGPTKHVSATLAAIKAVLAGDGERQSRQTQIADLLADRERAVAEEVRRAVADLHAKGRLVALSRERLRSANQQREDAKQKANRAGGSFVDVLAANLDCYKARNQLAVDVMGWHTARVRVREAQGLLAWECCGGP
jgi:hypothetical protein